MKRIKIAHAALLFADLYFSCHLIFGLANPQIESFLSLIRLATTTWEICELVTKEKRN